MHLKLNTSKTKLTIFPHSICSSFCFPYFCEWYYHSPSCPNQEQECFPSLILFFPSLHQLDQEAGHFSYTGISPSLSSPLLLSQFTPFAFLVGPESLLQLLTHQNHFFWEAKSVGIPLFKTFLGSSLISEINQKLLPHTWEPSSQNLTPYLPPQLIPCQPPKHTKCSSHTKAFTVPMNVLCSAQSFSFI